MTTDAPARRQPNSLAKTKEATVGAVETRIAELVHGKKLVLPQNYSASNALQAAWLALQEVETRDKKPVLEACSRNSIVQSLFSMVVQALDPGKKQGYFIPYGQSLTFQRSYFGTMAVAKRMGGVQEAFAELIYEDDTFEYEIRRGTKHVLKHTQSLDSIDSGKVRAAYAVVIFDDGRPDYTELMTWDQIQQSWSKSKMNPNSDKSTHAQFTSEMVKRTVLNRALKRFINSSSDDHLFLQAFNENATAQVEAAVEEDAQANANGEELDFPEQLDDAIEDNRTIDVDTPTEPPQRETAAAQESLGPGF